MSSIHSATPRSSGVHLAKPASNRLLLGLSRLDLVGVSVGGLIGLLVGVSLGSGLGSIVSFIAFPGFGLLLARIKVFGQSPIEALLRSARLPFVNRRRRLPTSGLNAIWQHSRKRMPQVGFALFGTTPGAGFITNHRRGAKVFRVATNPLWAVEPDLQLSQGRTWSQALVALSDGAPRDLSIVVRSDVIEDSASTSEDEAGLFVELDQLIRSGSYRLETTVSVAFGESQRRLKRIQTRVDSSARLLVSQLAGEAKNPLLELLSDAYLERVASNWLLGDANWYSCDSSSRAGQRVMEFWDRIVVDDTKIACLYVKDWPNGEVSPGFMDSVLTPVAPRRSVMMEFRPISPEIARRKTRSKVSEAMAQGRLRRSTGYLEDAGDEASMDENLRIEGELARGAGLFGYGCTVVVYSRSSVDLELDVRRCVSLAASSGITLERAYGRQLETFLASFVTGGSIR